jgi:cytochrome c biogenesis protein CcdA/thiol-disulfide isomerase/thioredoxin
MIVLLLFSFISGLVTIFAPCIWPLLPIILASSSTGGKSKPLGITLGVILSFAFFTLTLSYIIKIIPFDADLLRIIAVIVISFFGLTLLIPRLNRYVEGYVSRFSATSGVSGKNKAGFWGGFITGISLGIVWTPCAGPILATIATLAATKAVNFQVVLVTIAYVSGIGITLFTFSLLGNILFKKSRFLNKYTGKIQQIFGVIMILTALAILTNFDKVLQVKLLHYFPSYSSLLYSLESNQQVTTQLNELRGNNSVDTNKIKMPVAKPGGLPELGTAPEFNGQYTWLNSSPLKMKNLKGKVVLVDFWTYTCINCIRTLPYVTGWYEKYKEKGLVVIGVHTPEFEFEKKTENVKNALKQHSIHYPVVQDNDYEIWNSYNNQYWPAKYLIDSQGVIRYEHFGEGNYDETEHAIQKLLEEAGHKTSQDTVKVQSEVPSFNISPETYLGSARMQYLYPNGSVGNGTDNFELDESIPVNSFSYGGQWSIADEYGMSGTNASLAYHFHANKVFLVMRPGKINTSVRVKVFLDGKPIPQEFAGADVKDGILTVPSDNTYNLVDLHGNEDSHILKLEFNDQGTEVYAFTFG